MGTAQSKFRLQRGEAGLLVIDIQERLCRAMDPERLARMESGAVPHVLADAVMSRNEEDRRVGLSLCKDAGSVISTVESALFDLLGKAGSAEFKLVSEAVK